MKLISLRSSQAPVIESHMDQYRNSFIKVFEDCTLTGRNSHYPNCLLEANTQLINPYDERVMSLQRDSFYDNDIWPDYTSARDQSSSLTSIESRPCLFFVYNVDNYYHFLYDTLPYLWAYFQLKQQYPTLQILLNTSHPTKKTLAPFVQDTFAQLGLQDMIQIVKPGQVYSQLFVATSLTHGGRSNDPPSPLAFDVWRRFPEPTLSMQVPPKRFYVSRRSWIHGQITNMGTNYTTRRKCMNEDQVVELLAKYDIQEVFTELLTMEEKIAYFKSAELVVGVIGGGMCNLIFSPPITRSVCIATPYFLDINARFRYSMDHTTPIYSRSATHAPYTGNFPLYSRVKITNPTHPNTGQIGEVETIDITTSQIQLSISSNDVAGFSQDFQLKTVWVNQADVEALDLGLNSPYQCDLVVLEADIKRALNLE
jgi:hypothetical protein